MGGCDARSASPRLPGWQVSHSQRLITSATIDCGRHTQGTHIRPHPIAEEDSIRSVGTAPRHTRVEVVGAIMSSAQYRMLSVAEATSEALERTPALPPVTASLCDCLGRVLAEDVKAQEPLPPFPASMKVRPFALGLPFDCFTHFSE
jgi:hypothetical protein